MKIKITIEAEIDSAGNVLRIMRDFKCGARGPHLKSDFSSSTKEPAAQLLEAAFDLDEMRIKAKAEGREG